MSLHVIRRIDGKFSDAFRLLTFVGHLNLPRHVMNPETVYSFTVWNHQADRQQLAPRKATRQAIRQIGGKVLEETEEQIDPERLDGNGFLMPIDEKGMSA